ANCGARIAFRYFAVELLTALLFLYIWKAFPWQFAIAYWVFVSLLIAATFIDFEHLIIPDEITIGGAVAGLILSAIFPQLMGETTILRGLGFSLAAAACGFAALWIVVEAGKRVFGKKKHRLEKAENFSVTVSEDSAMFMLG